MAELQHATGKLHERPAEAADLHSVAAGKRHGLGYGAPHPVALKADLATVLGDEGCPGAAFRRSRAGPAHQGQSDNQGDPFHPAVPLPSSVSAAGMSMLKVVPWPGTLLALMVPRWASMM